MLKETRPFGLVYCVQKRQAGQLNYLRPALACGWGLWWLWLALASKLGKDLRRKNHDCCRCEGWCFAMVCGPKEISRKRSSFANCLRSEFMYLWRVRSSSCFRIIFTHYRLFLYYLVQILVLVHICGQPIVDTFRILERCTIRPIVILDALNQITRLGAQWLTTSSAFAHSSPASGCRTWTSSLWCKNEWCYFWLDVKGFGKHVNDSNPPRWWHRSEDRIIVK